MHTLSVKNFGFTIFFSGKSHLKKSPIANVPNCNKFLLSIVVINTKFFLHTQQEI